MSCFIEGIADYAQIKRGERWSIEERKGAEKPL